MSRKTTTLTVSSSVPFSYYRGACSDTVLLLCADCNRAHLLGAAVGDATEVAERLGWWWVFGRLCCPECVAKREPVPAGEKEN